MQTHGVREAEVYDIKGKQVVLAIYGNSCWDTFVSRREYSVNMKVNGLMINKVIIDPHYEEKHADTVNDEIILELVKTLNGSEAIHGISK